MPSDDTNQKDPLSRWIVRHPVLAVVLVVAMIAVGVAFRFLRLD